MPCDLQMFNYQVMRDQRMSKQRVEKCFLKELCVDEK